MPTQNFIRDTVSKLLLLVLLGLFFNNSAKANVIQEIVVKLHLLEPPFDQRYAINEATITIDSENMKIPIQLKKVEKQNGIFKSKNPINLNGSKIYTIYLQSNNYMPRKITLKYNNKPKVFSLHMVKKDFYKYDLSYNKQGKELLDCIEENKTCVDKSIAYYERAEQDLGESGGSVRNRIHFMYNLARAYFHGFFKLDYQVCHLSLKKFRKVKDLLNQDGEYRKKGIRYGINKETLNGDINELKKFCNQ